MARDIAAEKEIDNFISALSACADLEESQRIRDEERRVANAQFEAMRKEVAAYREQKRVVLVAAQALKPAPVRQKQRRMRHRVEKAPTHGKRRKTAVRARKQARKAKSQ